MRANLLPLLVMLPAAAFSQVSRPTWIRRTLIVAAVGAIIVAAAIARNWIAYGEPTLSRNAAYNLYIGNQDVYAEDLDLFHPRAHAGTDRVSATVFRGHASVSNRDSRRTAERGAGLDCAAPGAIPEARDGRLARLFAPKTDVLELAGGEAASACSPQPGCAARASPTCSGRGCSLPACWAWPR